jgi:hypothetical protein
MKMSRKRLKEIISEEINYLNMNEFKDNDKASVKQMKNRREYKLFFDRLQKLQVNDRVEKAQLISAIMQKLGIDTPDAFQKEFALIKRDLAVDSGQAEVDAEKETKKAEKDPSAVKVGEPEDL